MGFTRPGVLAFALFLGLYGIWRWVARRREPLPMREIVHIVALGLLAVVVGFSWQVIAGVVTGRRRTRTWRPSSRGGGNWVPGEPASSRSRASSQGAALWFGRIWGLGEVDRLHRAGGIRARASPRCCCSSRTSKRLGVEVRLWVASYLVYLLAVFFPQSSIFRLLVPLSPLWGAVALPRSTACRVGVLAACLVGQWWWIYNMYALGEYGVLDDPVDAEPAPIGCRARRADYPLS